MYNNISHNNNWKNLCQELVLENCLIFGLNPQLTSKRITKFLLGTRDTLEIFKLYELRYLLLKIYPLIHILFHNPRVNSRFEFKISKSKPLRQENRSSDLFSLKRKPFPKQKISFSYKHKNLPPQILFATTTQAFSNIISDAANVCNMPYHKKRWINGSITAAISDIYNNDPWHYIQNGTQKDISYHFNKIWGSNRENHEKIKEKNKSYGRSRWPSLVVIPDISNNIMILSEIKKVGIPVIGLVNSHCSFEIDYPIFAQDQTLASVYFFCHFLSTLMAKEMAYSQHKHYALQKIKSHVRKKTHLLSSLKIFGRKKRKMVLSEIILRQRVKPSFERVLFFKYMLPKQRKVLRTGRAKKYLLKKNIYFFNKFKFNKFKFCRVHERKFGPVCKKLFGYLPNEKFKFFRKLYEKNPSLFWFRRSFKRLMFFVKAFGFNSSWIKHFPNILKFQNAFFEKYDSNVKEMRFKNEEKKKYSWKTTQKIFITAQRNLLQKHLWILRTMSAYWKYQILLGKTNWFNNNAYYWCALQNTYSDFRWQDHLYLLKKGLLLYNKNTIYPRKHFWNKKKYKRRHKRAKAFSQKQPWKKWIKKERTPSPFWQKRSQKKTKIFISAHK